MHGAWAQGSISTRMLCEGSGARALQTALSRWLWALTRPSQDKHQVAVHAAALWCAAEA